MLSECKRILFNQAGLSVGASVVVGVSGGIDSMVLLHLIHQTGMGINVVHINYHKRGGDSDADELLVRNVCAKIGADLEVVHWEEQDVGSGNFQDIARDFRRDRFQKRMQETGSEAIVLGHNKDDLYETLIMRVLRGAAPSNWNALPEVDHPYVRPLVTTTRAEIERYAAEHMIEWRDDESNKTSVYARNFLRNELIPEMDRLYPGWKANVERIKTYGDTYKMAIDQLLHPFGDAAMLPIEWLASIGPPLNTAIIHRIHEQKGLPNTASLPDAILQLIHSQPGRHVDLGGNIAWHRDREYLVLDLQLHEPVTRYDFTLKSIRDNELAFDYGRIGCSGQSRGEPAFSIQAFEGAYVLRSVEVGDKIRIEGGSKAVSDLLNEWGVPMRLKPRAYVLTLDGSVVAVIFSHPGFETRWRVDPKHRGESESSFYISIHH